MKARMGPRPKPTAIRRMEGNRGKRAWNHDEPEPPDAAVLAPAGVVAEKVRVTSAGLYWQKMTVGISASSGSE